MNLNLDDKVNIGPLVKSIAEITSLNVSDVYSQMYHTILTLSASKDEYKRYQELGEAIIWCECCKEQLKGSGSRSADTIKAIHDCLIPMIGEFLNLKNCYKYPYTLISSSLKDTLVKATLGLIFLEFGGECIERILKPTWEKTTEAITKLPKCKADGCSTVEVSTILKGRTKKSKKEEFNEACRSGVDSPETEPKFLLPSDFIVSLPHPGNYVGALNNLLAKYCPEIECPKYVENVSINTEKHLLFECEVRVCSKGISWSGHGSSLRKKDARKLACKDLLVKLTRVTDI